MASETQPAEAPRTPPIVAFTLGDPNGIGPEVALKCLSDTRIRELADPVLIGSAAVVRAHAHALGLDNLDIWPVTDPSFEVAPTRLKIIDSAPGKGASVDFGKETAEAGQQAFQAVRVAVSLAMEGRVDAIVTGPISKKAISLAGYGFAGHTDYLVERTEPGAHIMMMVADDLRVGLLTAHVPLAEVARVVTKDAVVAGVNTIDASLRQDFGIERGRIAVLGLNPHAGERGVLGREESGAIIPAIRYCSKGGIMAFGPFPADGFFGSRAFRGYDAILAMYHDQGLIPFKTLAFNEGVNFTAGLPIVRTSCDHGTAFDIAGRNRADEQSTRQALYLALDVVRQRRYADNSL
ncbi:MAG: 4-hydroxythreonine-4-phosphate dehydrogenase PdxA [Bacteroidota bacterium]|nr:4-hydroxythreonine-4-phosphate dehydrogenase PdxA [Bacteroidota bacterium]MDE2957485.1 4-hydroxythreonine-4-phosphate dehydrogenase PdxA [Bacteroidota bacterium]